jgi:hypothetical protein
VESGRKGRTLAGPELLMALIAVLAWGRLLGGRGAARSLFRLGVESVAVHVVVSTLVAVGLVTCGAFGPALGQSLSAILPLSLLLWARPPWLVFRAGAMITRLELITLLILVGVMPVAQPRMEPLRLVDDGEVYTHAAIHHLFEGSLVGTIPARDQLKGNVLTAFDRDNVLHMGAQSGIYLPGTYVFRRSDFVFQGFPGWPMLMAQWAGLFGLPLLFHSVLFAFSLAVLLFGFLLQEMGLRPLVFGVAVGLFASSPLLLFFSKYTTSEAFLLLLFLFVIYFLSAGGVHGAALAVAGVLLIVVTHISTLLYSPLVLLVVLEAYRSRSRVLSVFSVGAFAALLAGLPLGLVFSPLYVQDIYRGIFKRVGITEPQVGLLVAGAAYLAGLTLATLALRRASNGDQATEETAPWGLESGALLRNAIRAVLLVIAAWILYRGYQLGWTDYFAEEVSAKGAWRWRKDYSGGGWPSLLHLNIVQMSMATSMIGLPVVLWLAFWKGDRLCATLRRSFLLAAVLLPLAIYTFVRVDTSFNYYPSRYFIPVLVPAVMLLFGELVGAFRFRAAVLAGLVVAGLAFNVRHGSVLYRSPVRQDELRFVQEVGNRVGKHRVLFIRNDERNDREALLMLALPLAARWNTAVINVVGTAEMSADRLIRKYARQLQLRDAGVLTRRPPGDGNGFESVVLMRRQLQPSILYPTETREWRRQYFLHNVVFRR